MPDNLLKFNIRADSASIRDFSSQDPTSEHVAKTSLGGGIGTDSVTGNGRGFAADGNSTSDFPDSELGQGPGGHGPWEVNDVIAIYASEHREDEKPERTGFRLGSLDAVERGPRGRARQNSLPWTSV